jgi:hypothetical protein
LKTAQVPNGKWIIWDDHRAYGPYDTKVEADSDRVGMERFEKFHNRPGFMTSEKKVSK